MGDVTGDRFCPICEQIVPREVEGVSVKISPARKVFLHDGCGEKIYIAYEAEMTRRVEALEE